MNIRCILFFLLFSLSLSCSKEGKNSDFSNTAEYFGPNYKDTIVPLQAKKLNALLDFSGWVSTHEFMQSLVSIFEYAPSSPVPYILLDKYYSNANTTTKVTIQNGTYVEAALGIYGPDIFNSINVGNTDNYKYLKDAFATWDTNIVKTASPAYTVSQIIQVLSLLPEHLEKHKVSKNVASAIASTLDVYINALLEVEKKLSLLQEENRSGVLESNTKLIQQAVALLQTSGIVNEEDYQQLMKQFSFPLEIANKLKEQNIQSISSILFDILRYNREKFLIKVAKTDMDQLSGEEYSVFVAEFPEPMQEFARIFGKDSDTAILWYQKTEMGFWDVVTNPVRSFYFNQLITSLQEKGIAPLLQQIEDEVNKNLIKELINTLVVKTQDLPSSVSKIVLDQFEKSEKGFYSDFYNQIKTLASQKIKNDLLNGEDSFPGIDGKYLYWPVEETKDTFQSFFVTGGKEIGSSIQANIYFFENIDKAPPSISDKKFKTYTFAFLNRLLAIFGYRDFNGNLSRSLHQKFSRTDSVNLDIYTYDLETGVFALPDNLILSTGYKVASQIDQNLVQTVGGRASLLKASAKLLEYFADYNVNAFDRDFSSFQFEGFSVFPKEPIFDLSLGSISILLRNLTKGEAIFFDSKGKLLPASGDIYKDSHGAGSVALVARRGDQIVDNVQGVDTADYIIALSSLLDSLRDLPKAKTGLLSRLVDGEQKDLKAIMDLIPVLRKLQYGLGIFLFNKMTKDGWLTNTYFIKTDTTSEVDYNLIGQLKLIQAMLSIYKEWKADLFLWAAIDSYYVLNKKFLAPTEGYKLQHAFPLYEVTEIWKTLIILQQTVQQLPEDKKVWWTLDSDKQLSYLVDFYRANWQGMDHVE